MTQAADAVRVEIAGQVATVVLDRPPVNALSRGMIAALHGVAKDLARRDDVRAVVLYGENEVFSAGADIRELEAMSPDEAKAYARALQDAFAAVAAIPKPVIAAIVGYALGGGLELALTADRRICDPEAHVGLPEIRLGVIPGAGGTQRLTRVVGLGAATDMIYTGSLWNAGKAAQRGLIDHVVVSDDLDDDPSAPAGPKLREAAFEWAAKFANGPVLALAAAKSAVHGTVGLDMGAALRHESALFAELWNSDDQKAGMQAFLSKSEPKFTGR